MYIGKYTHYNPLQRFYLFPKDQLTGTHYSFSFFNIFITVITITDFKLRLRGFQPALSLQRSPQTQNYNDINII